MRRIFLPVALLVVVSFILSGCVVRTYRKTQDRVDQNLSEGNRGYLMGSSSQQDSDRKMTRTTQVVEIELRSPVKFERRKDAPDVDQEEFLVSEEYLTDADLDGNRGYIMDDYQSAAVVVDFKDYTVLKNDTLQKISKKFYGTTKRWNDIYEVNKDILASPDQIMPGEVIRIPEISAIGAEEDIMLEKIK